MFRFVFAVILPAVRVTRHLHGPKITTLHVYDTMPKANHGTGPTSTGSRPHSFPTAPPFPSFLWETSTRPRENDRNTYQVVCTRYMVRHPRVRCIVFPLLSLEVATPNSKSIYSRLIYCESASKEVFSRMQLTLHTARPTPHGASRLVQAVPAWSVKTRRAPSRHYIGMRGSMVIRLQPCMTRAHTPAPPPFLPEKTIAILGERWWPRKAK